MLSQHFGPWPGAAPIKSDLRSLLLDYNRLVMRPLIEISTAAHFYDALAPHYREYCRSKLPYLAAVDHLVIENILPGADSLLDVGAGDGLRAERFAKVRGLPVLVLVEPSECMAAYCEQRKATEVWRVRAEELM